ncbi:MAG: PEGA domain-containing protein [Myxococcales bacterium]|nr:PEGA domain-containing protein [Myxococcales bacterium]
MGVYSKSAAVLVLAAALVPRSALAQRRGPSQPALSANEQQAAQRFDRGVQLAREGDWAGAVAEFDAAYALSGNVEILFNLAAAHENASHYVEAAEALAQYRARAPAASVGRRASELDAAAARIESRIGRIIVALDAPGLEVNVDGRAYTAEQARAGVRVSAGDRRVTLRAPRFVAREQRVTIAGGEARTISEPLTRTQSGIMVECNVRGARIMVDGRELGRTPIESALVVDEGRHTVRVTADGYNSYETVVDAVEGGATVRAQLAWLDEIPDSVAGRLVVRTNERGGFATIARRRIPMDGSYALPPGTHRLRVELPGFIPSERDVSVTAGESLSVDVLLRPTAAYRLAYDQHAQLLRRLWVGTAIPGFTLLATTGVAAIVLLVRNRTFDAEYTQLEMDLAQCARTACPNSRAIIDRQMQISQQSTNESTWLWVTGISGFVGVGLAIASISFFAVAPPTDRFTRAPEFRVGAGPGSLSARLAF